MAGIYIHIPFCKQACSYCDFHFSTRFSPYRARMIRSIAEELIQRRTYLSEKTIETLYFGGGTPSLLTPIELESLIAAARNNFKFGPTVEVTLEANPDDISKESLTAWKAAGVTRLSIGLQSFKSEDLDWMNRAHTVEEAENCLTLVKNAGFDNTTVDLIYGLPNLTTEEWKNHIRRVIEQDVAHISAYCLTIEPKTALSSWVKKGKIKPVEDEVQSEQFLSLLEELEGNGYEQYEISNFCKPGFESLHNSNYWKGEMYLGVGPSAHSFNGRSRAWNCANNAQYMSAIEANQNEQLEEEQLSTIDVFNEALLTGLRTKYGVMLSSLNEELRSEQAFVQQIQHFVVAGWMTCVDNQLLLTREGKLRADFIASELFAETD